MQLPSPRTGPRAVAGVRVGARARRTAGRRAAGDRPESTRPTERPRLRPVRTVAAAWWWPGVATQYQEDLPVVRPLVRRFDIEVGHCSRCRRVVVGVDRPVYDVAAVFTTN